MTPPKSSPQPAVSVEQIDREAAFNRAMASLITAHGMRCSWMDDALAPVLSGEEDQHPDVQAFADFRHRLSAAPPADGVLREGLASIIADIRHRERNAEALWREEGAPTIDKCDKVPGASAFWAKAAFHRLANDLEALSAAPKAPTAPPATPSSNDFNGLDTKNGLAPAAPTAPIREAGGLRFVAVPVWRETEEEEECWTSEVQAIGGHAVVATVHAGSETEVIARRDAILAALSPSADAGVREALENIANCAHPDEPHVYACAVLNEQDPVTSGYIEMLDEQGEG